LARSYLCALAVVLIAGTTTAPELFSALRWFGAPRALVVTIQFLYRFLVLMGEQAMRLRYAALARRGPGRYRRSLKAVAAVSIAALFASAYGRAERVHRSMLSRGYTGELHAISAMKFASADWAFLLATIGLTLAIRAR
jgi:cobalt/nickel transport system permease protein